MYQRELDCAVEMLCKGKILLYPSDTIWGIGCDATNSKAVETVFTIKNRPKNKAMICLVSDIIMLSHYVPNIPLIAKNIIEKNAKPTTIIYEHAQGIAPKLFSTDGSIAIRVVDEGFCKMMINQFGKAIVSTSANLSKATSPNCFEEIAPEILDNVDYAIKLYRENKYVVPSTIIRIYDEHHTEVIRP